MMENNIFKILHAYHPNQEMKLEKVDILVYRDTLILSGYEKRGEAMSSFIHFQFHDLNIKGVYSTQLQLAENYIPEAYKQAVIKNVFHCEPHFVIVPQPELDGINSYSIFSTLHSEPAEKLLIDDLDAIHSREYYNYPFRVYNDMFFAFDDAQFYSYHRPAFEALKHKSMGSTVYYASIKSKSLDIICFRDGQLLLANNYDMVRAEDAAYFMNATLSDLGIKPDSEHIFVSCILKEQKDIIFGVLKSQFANMNAHAESTFGFPASFWDCYGDLILCN